METVGLVGFAGVVVFGLLYIVFFFKGISLKLPIIGMVVFVLVVAAAVFLPKLAVFFPELLFFSDRPSPTVPVEKESRPPETGSFPQLLLDKRGLVITATGLVEHGVQGSALTVSIENRSETDVTVEVRDACVNGWMMDTSFYAAVAAGQRIESSIVFFAFRMERSGIETIADMEFSFHILDQNRVTFLDSDTVRVRTPAADTYQYPVDDSGEELYNENGVRIISRGFSGDESIFGPGLVLFMENTTGRTVTVQARGVSVNGEAVNVTFSEDILAGKRSVAAVILRGASLEEIRELNFYLRVTDRDQRTILFDTEPLTVVV